MKIIYLLSSIFLLILTGCSTTYNISQFSSREKFYESFNNFAKTKKVKVTLTNDSSFYVHEGAYILDDSLKFYNNSRLESTKISSDNIKSISNNNRWLGALSGSLIAFVTGAGTGYIAGFILGVITYNSGPPHPNLADQHVGAEIVGGGFAIIGGVIGYLIGDNVIYIFKQ
ncbi:MAG: hypothetical protein ACYDA4_15065 [Ignavibacteriaceae bacterium]